MAKAKPSLRKTRNDGKKMKKNKKKQMDFSQSEIDVAEQLIQLSGDSDNHNDNENDSNHEEISDGDTTSLIFNFTSKQNTEDFFDEEDGHGFDPRRKKRFKSLSEIYGSNNNPLSSVKHHR